jgi:hypothetical protein
MRKRLITSLAVVSVFLSASPAFASHGPYEGVPVYNVVMFSDATKTTMVGKIWFQYCTYDELSGDGAEYRIQGIYTAHQSESLIGYCWYEQFGPIH